MKTKVFAHRGIIGIDSSPEANLVAHPGGGNIGCVADATEVEISAEALTALKKVKRSHDDIGDVDVFKAGDGKVIFAWLGGYRRIVDPSRAEGSRTYDPSMLTATEGIEAPEDFKAAADKYLDEK